TPLNHVSQGALIPVTGTELTDEEIIRAVEPNPEVNNSDEEEEVENGGY
ncbi:8348_t:CDS:2, partial [Entrophospora sp. SA101]